MMIMAGCMRKLIGKMSFAEPENLGPVPQEECEFH